MHSWDNSQGDQCSNKIKLTKGQTVIQSSAYISTFRPQTEWSADTYFIPMHCRLPLEKENIYFSRL